MKLNQYQKETKAIPDDGKTLAAASIGLSSDIGKLQQVLAARITKAEPVAREDAAKLIGSVLWQLSFIATGLDVTLEEAAIANIVEKRQQIADAAMA